MVGYEDHQQLRTELKLIGLNLVSAFAKVKIYVYRVFFEKEMNLMDKPKC